MPQQMETLYTEELCTDSQLNECRSAGDTLTRRRNAAIVRLGANRSGELCLNPISLVSRYFYIRRGLRDQWSFAIDFLTPSFGSQPSLRQLHPFPPLFANLYFFTSLFLHLHSCHLDYCTLSFSSPASVAASISDLACMYIRRRWGGVGENKALEDPLRLHFPEFLRGADSIAAFC